MSVKQKISLPSGVVTLRLFGSLARAEADAASDLDILAVLECALTEELSGNIERQTEKLFGKKPSISWYSRTRLQEYFNTGHLFAWHIFLESLAISGSSSPDAIDRLGKPARYSAAEEDILSLIEILRSIPSALERCPENASYEGGLIFVCLRNIALSASWYTSTGLSFSRASPFVLETALGIEFPISKDDYESLVRARICGQRGMPFEALKRGNVLPLWNQGLEWAQRVLAFVKEVEGECNNKQTSVPAENRA